MYSLYLTFLYSYTVHFKAKPKPNIESLGTDLQFCVFDNKISKTSVLHHICLYIDTLN